VVIGATDAVAGFIGFSALYGKFIMIVKRIRTVIFRGFVRVILDVHYNNFNILNFRL